MRLENKNLFAKLSLLLSILGLIGLFLINYNLVIRYNTTDGKGRALFGIYETMDLPYKYIVGLLQIVGIWILITAWREREDKRLILFAIALWLAVAIGIFIRFWRIFIEPVS